MGVGTIIIAFSKQVITELESSVIIEVDVLGSRPNKPTVSVDVTLQQHVIPENVGLSPTGN